MAGHAANPTFQTLTKWVPTVVPPDETDPGVLAEFTTLVPDPVARVLYAVSEDGFSPNHWLAAYDSTSLLPLGKGLAIDALSAAIPDVQGGRLLAVGMPASSTSFANTSVPTLETFIVSGSPSGTSVQRQRSAPLASLKGLWVAGMYQANATDLYLLAASYQAGQFVSGTMQVAKVDLSSLTDGAVTVSWTVPLGACQLPIAVTPQKGMGSGGSPAAGLGYSQARHALYFGCTVPSPQSLSGNPRSPLPAGVGELPIPTDGTAPTAAGFLLYSHVGNFSGGDSFFDRPSERLILTSSGGGTPTTIYGFDTATNAYVGSIGAGLNAFLGAGVNQATGQFYGFNQNPQVGLISAFIRLTPVGQADYDTDYVPKTQPSLNTLAIDAASNRLFLYEVSSDTVHYFFLVVGYTGGVLTPPVPVKPDGNTTDVSEQPGLTGRTYTGSAQGYGAIQRWVGGMDAAVADGSVVGLNTQGTSPVGPGTRELRLAYVNDLSLSLSQSSASSIALDRDGSNTGRDQATLCGAPYTQGPPGTPPPPSPPAQWSATCSWPLQVAQCSNYGGAAQKDAQSSTFGTAAATCDVAHQQASTSAAVNGAPVSGVSVSSASVDGSVSVDSQKGTVSTVTSVAKGVDILNGTLKIGEVSQTTTSRAHGRAGSAQTTSTKAIQNVVLAGTSLCTTQCDPNTLAARVNAQLAGLARVDFPPADPNLLSSPGGYQAVYRRSLADQVQEGDLNDQPADRGEVPAMVITVFLGDNDKPSRIVTYLAGAEVEARYGIYLVGQDGSSSDGPGTSDAFPSTSGGLTTYVPASGLPTIPPGGTTRTAPKTAKPPGHLSPLAGLLPPGGWRWVAEHPVEAMKLLFMWAVLLSPVYLAARRWLLIQRNRVLQEAMA
jgi:hypothetical protein